MWQYNGYYDADGLGWHFDRSEFGVNLVLQEPSSGGAFDYHRLTRSEADPWAFGAVERVLRAAEPHAAGGGPARAASAERIEGLTAGSLVLFAGRLSLHRVSPVRGPRPRINAILTYESEPGQLANPCAWLRRPALYRARADVADGLHTQPVRFRRFTRKVLRPNGNGAASASAGGRTRVKIW